MTVIGIIGCTSLLICAFGLNDSMNELTEWNFEHINHYDSELIIDSDANSSAIDEVEKEVAGEKIMKSVIAWVLHTLTLKMPLQTVKILKMLLHCLTRFRKLHTVQQAVAVVTMK